MTSSGEPAADRPALRRFKDPGYVPAAATLRELRGQIDQLDRDIVRLLAQRARCVKDATRFKLDAHQASAPARQAEVFEKVRMLAQAQGDAFPGLPDVVEATYRSMVAAFIAAEQQLLDQTEMI